MFNNIFFAVLDELKGPNIRCLLQTLLQARMGERTRERKARAGGGTQVQFETVEYVTFCKKEI